MWPCRLYFKFEVQTRILDDICPGLLSSRLTFGNPKVRAKNHWVWSKRGCCPPRNWGGCTSHARHPKFTQDIDLRKYDLFFQNDAPTIWIYPCHMRVEWIHSKFLINYHVSTTPDGKNPSKFPQVFWRNFPSPSSPSNWNWKLVKPKSFQFHVSLLLGSRKKSPANKNGRELGGNEVLVKVWMLWGSQFLEMKYESFPLESRFFFGKKTSPGLLSVEGHQKKSIFTVCLNLIKFMRWDYQGYGEIED